MRVLISNDDGLDTLLQAEEMEQAVACMLKAEGADPLSDVEVSISFVRSAEMRSLNASWRGIDAPTDVLSFECDGLDGAGEQDPLELGDVILCPEVIAAQAADFGNTPVEECRLMLVHGLLHLVGYDHMNEDDAAEMEGRELAILRELAVLRGDDPAGVRIGPVTRHEYD
ncbi:rRNA maturation RNase YbeY [Enorma massiliensis]|uniref:rRNA maturation RNase YbeY n=1 Tax=Enorma massiliensis TaxID=1472761 RepID=UPI000821F8F4|nr:Probable rRNA maturation factor [uncultured Collinsella sp.]